MGKYEMNTADMRRFFNDIHTMATSLKALSDLAKKDAELHPTTNPAAMKTTISDLLDSVASPYAGPHQVPLEPDPNERG